jgi:gamma-aminobutyric acid type B receptor
MMKLRCLPFRPFIPQMGLIVIYGALFSKLWRVNKVLQSHRAKILIHQVVWPFALLLVAAIAVLSVWSGLDPLEWERVEVDKATGDSIGECTSENMKAFVVPLALVMLVPMVLTGVMAWKTKDVDGAYAESWWIFVLFLVQLQVRFKPRERFSTTSFSHVCAVLVLALSIGDSGFCPCDRHSAR